MSDIKTLSYTDRTSWPRIAMVISYLLTRKRLLKILIAFPIVSVGLFLLSYYGTHAYLGTDTGRTLANNSAINLLTIFIALSPLMFAKPASREINITLPALGLEKTIAVFIVCCLIIPVCIVLPAEIMSWFYFGFDNDCLSAIFMQSIHSDMDEIFSFKFRNWAILFSIAFLLSELFTVMWAVFGSRRSATAHSIWGFLGVMFSPVIVFSLGTLILMYKNGLFYEETDQATIQLGLDFINFFKGATIGWCCYAAFAFYKVCYSICRKQI